MANRHTYSGVYTKCGFVQLISHNYDKPLWKPESKFFFFLCCTVYTKSQSCDDKVSFQLYNEDKFEQCGSNTLQLHLAREKISA